MNKKSTDISFIIIKEDTMSPLDYLNKLNIDYVPFNDLTVSERLYADKQTYKLIDSKSLAFVTNPKYEIIGLAKKRAKK
ncbi:hypothetical protein RCO48_02545 [Peribacillus frigoritolerans]|nr:hypothetical protein [Peribacillus frigoritolerans]